MDSSEWHFPRTDFAIKIYEYLTKSREKAVSLFGARRIGKTEFLLQDLGPYARSQGCRVVYVSFWRTPSALAAMIYALKEALSRGAFLERAAQSTSFELGAELAGTSGKIKVDPGKIKSGAPDELIEIVHTLFARLAKAKQPAILLLDEFQELARGEHSHDLIAALRTILDVHKDSLRCVFTGSSRAGLDEVFSAKDAPFFQFADRWDMPLLDERFVEHQLAVYRKWHKRRVDPDKALSIFEQCHRRPELFHRWLIKFASAGSASESEVLDQALEAWARSLQFSDHWSKLNAGQRRVTLMLADGTAELFGQSGRVWLKERFGAAAPSTSSIQATMRKLKRADLVENWNEGWRCRDPLFELWVKRRPEADFHSAPP